MRNLLAFVAAAALTVAGVGWYLGWFKVQSAPAPAGQRTVNININTDKIAEDLHNGSEYLLERGADKLQRPSEKLAKPAAAPRVEPGKAPTGN